ncbi:Transcriptional regulatory protein pro1-like protein 2 [Stagonosporopsis vannaccii]|nr:Transcriptional regulatory protein pro1-like protein 2 [Stagonosporopsis vannaccii]
MVREHHATQQNVRNGGCWTCKLRRKKCDETPTTCDNCASLKIGCGYGPKPPWMDGGAQQKRKAMSVKEEIKRNIAQRRERSHVHNEAPTDIINRRYGIISDVTITNSLSMPQSTAASEPQIRPPQFESQHTLRNEPTLLATLPWSHHQHQRSDTLEAASPTEWNFIMKYLDFVFPALFSFYQPHIFDTGRSWLLLLLRKSKVAYHATLGLSCYYFTMALSDAGAIAELAACKQLRWDEVERESEKCFVSLQAEVAALTANIRGAPTSVLDKVELMNGITQVIIFEMTMGKAAPWDTHLPAAISLFEEIMTHSQAVAEYRGQPQSKLSAVLLGMGEPLWTNPWPSNHIWSPVQAGFRFYAGLLVFIDVIASTATGQTPRLQSHHRDVLATNDDSVSLAGEAEVRLSNIVGCPNSVASLIARISAITAWKQTQATESRLRLSEMEMFARSTGMRQELNDEIAALNAGLAIRISSNANKSDSDGSIPMAMVPKPLITSIFALVWALATRLYLSAILNTSARDDPAVQADVAHVLVLLNYVQPKQLRSLAWPIFVTGCLASDVQESSLRVSLAGLSSTDTVGALKDVHQMLKQVWALRGGHSDHDLDITSCFAILGSPILLI